VRVLHEPKGKEGRKATGVVYWMSRDQRANDNWALLYAQRNCSPPPTRQAPFTTHACWSGDPHAELAVKSGVPLAVAFCLLPSFKGASIRYLPSPPQSLLCVGGGLPQATRVGTLGSWCGA
jgi:deoxyribodipyrimidine photo-lyase